MAPEKAPAFQFYPKDFLTDERVQQMSHTERGVYITLLCLCWLHKSLPSDVAALAKMVNVPQPRFQKLWGSLIRPCFFVGPDGRLYQKRLEVERQKQAKFSRRQSDAAVSRWDRSGNAVALPTACPREEDRRQKTLVSEKGSGEKQPAVMGALVEADIADRARILLDHYAEWYAKYRHGAKLRLIHNQLEFGEACSLCEHWADERLEKLAAVVLTTDDAFISNTDRGFKIFAMKASWADDRLTAVEREHRA